MIEDRASTHARDARERMDPERRALYDLWDEISARRRAAREVLRYAETVDEVEEAQAAYDAVQREANEMRRWWVQVRYAAHGLGPDGVPLRARSDG